MQTKIKTLLTIALFGCYINSVAQKTDTWDKWKTLEGEWIGEGNGQPGEGEGSFSFHLDLNQKILVRKSHSEYVSKENNSNTIHDDLMIVYPDFTGEPSKAIFFDNEGHIINYSITYFKNAIILTSEKKPNIPVFRLTYDLINEQTCNIKFEMSHDSMNFTTFIEGKSKKTK